eukprot:7576817-Karenia_brevis.AAC.1
MRILGEGADSAGEGEPGNEGERGGDDQEDEPLQWWPMAHVFGVPEADVDQVIPLPDLHLEKELEDAQLMPPGQVVLHHAKEPQPPQLPSSTGL